MLSTEIDLERSIRVAIERDAKNGPFVAEIVPKVSPLWHILRTQPGQENIAAAHLAARRFGVYVPTFRRKLKIRGRPTSRRVLLIPGHVFLFVWDVKAHWRRVRACPGVTSIMVKDSVPIVVQDRDIHRMQWLEFKEDEFSPRMRRRRKYRETGGIVTISCKSFIERAPSLTDGQRVSEFHRALGLVGS